MLLECMVDCLNQWFHSMYADARKVAASAIGVGFALKQCFAFHTVMDHMGIATQYYTWTGWTPY